MSGSLQKFFRTMPLGHLNFFHYACLYFAFLFTGCLFSTHEKVAGGAEDFPNTVALGYAVSAHISDHTEWDQFSIIPSTLPSVKDVDSLIQSPDTVTGPAAPKLSKSAAAPLRVGAIGNDTVIWNLNDSATLGIVTRIHFYDGLIKSHRDTIVYRYPKPPLTLDTSFTGQESLLILSNHAADTYKPQGRLQGYQYDNLDSVGGFDRASFYDKIPAANGTFKNHSIVMLPGPDGDFTTRLDNIPAYFASSTIKPSTSGSNIYDTLESFETKDADGDGSFWGKGDSGVVEFTQKKPSPANRPSVDLIVQKMRSIIFKDESKSYPIDFSEARTEKDGKKTVFSIRGSGTDSTFSPGDTAWVALRIVYPTGAKLLEKISRYQVLLGKQPKQFQDNKLLQYTLEARWKKDSLITTRFKMIPDQPLLSNELSIKGSISVSADFEDEGNGNVTGRFENKLIDVDYEKTTKQGKIRRFRVRWDDRGAILSQKLLN